MTSRLDDAESSGSRRVLCRRVGGTQPGPSADTLVVEEPLELRVGGVPVATLMRTPGSDRQLALGFFLTEGWIASLADVGAIALCARRAPGDAERPEGREAGGHGENVADLIPTESAPVRAPAAAGRLLVASSSCGVCGKRTIEEVLARTPLASSHEAGASAPRPAPDGLRVAAGTLLGIPAALRRAQRIFDATGSVHAAGIFDAAGALLRVEEDVGRHNAVDKVIGWALLEGLVPLSRQALLVSGRVSFEIVQKASAAGLPLVAGVSGVSSLARDLAERAGVTLAGFVRGESLVLYAHPARVVG